MKALVLTYDRYVKLTEHMIRTYEERWPDHPFKFVVPYNDNYPINLKNKFDDRVYPIQTESSIRPTMLNLLSEVGDEEWIYWAIDDKYLIDIKESAADTLYHWIRDGPEFDIDGVSFVRARRLLSGEALSRSTRKTRDGIKLHERSDYNQIWLHQFLKGKVLKHLFQNMPDPRNAKEMDTLKFEVGLPEDHNLYVTNKNYAVLGESTSRGKLTQNCISSFEKYGMRLPMGFEHSDKNITIGDMRRYRNLLYQFDLTRSIFWN